MIRMDHISSPLKLGTAVKRIRKEKMLSQVELAKLARLPQSTISDIEKGRKNATLETVLKIIRALEINFVLESGALKRRPGTKSKAREVLDLIESVGQ